MNTVRELEDMIVSLTVQRLNGDPDPPSEEQVGDWRKDLSERGEKRARTLAYLAPVALEMDPVETAEMAAAMLRAAALFIHEITGNVAPVAAMLKRYGMDFALNDGGMN